MLQICACSVRGSGLPVYEFRVSRLPQKGNLNPKPRAFLVAEFISPKKGYTFSFILGSIIPKSVKCIHSATKLRDLYLPLRLQDVRESAQGQLRRFVLAKRLNKILQAHPDGPLNFDWVLAKGFNLSYPDKETLLFTIDPCYGTLN